MTSFAEARAFARTRTEGTLDGGAEPLRVAVAFTPEGHPIVAAAEPLPPGRLVLLLEGAGGSLRVDGEAVDLEEGDEARLLAIHADSAAHRRRLAPAALEYAADGGAPIRLVAGDWLLPTPAWRDGEAGINEHMNDDHVDAMQRMCRVYRGVDAADPRLVAVDPEGLVMREGKQLIQVAFDEPAYSHDEVHHATVRLAREARKREQAGAGGAEGRR